MCVFISFFSLGIAVLALQEAQKARDEANESRAVEIRHVRTLALPDLPEQKQASLPEFIEQKEVNHVKHNSFHNHADPARANNRYLSPPSSN